MTTTVRELNRCIFCGGSEMTREHLIADWAHRAFAKSRKPQGLLRASIAKDGLFTAYDGDPVATAKVVCRACNNGWLSGIDNAAARVMRPLLRGEREVELDRDGQSAVAAWVYKCALVFDAVQHGRDGPLASVRALFMETKLAGPGCVIYVGPSLPPPSLLVVGDPPTTVNLWTLGIRPADGTMTLTVNVEGADGSTTTPGTPTEIPIPGYQIMVGGLNAYLGGRAIFPIAAESLKDYALVWPAQEATVTARAASIVTHNRAA